jgi:hypothetical protein
MQLIQERSETCSRPLQTAIEEVRSGSKAIAMMPCVAGRLCKDHVVPKGNAIVEKTQTTDIDLKYFRSGSFSLL